MALKKQSAPRRKGDLAPPDMKLYNILFEMNNVARHWAGYDSGHGRTRIERLIAAPFKLTEIKS